MTTMLGPPNPKDFPSLPASGLTWLRNLLARTGRGGTPGYLSFQNAVPVAGLWHLVTVDTAGHARMQGLTAALTSGEVLTWALPIPLSWASKISVCPTTALGTFSAVVTGANLILTNGPEANSFFVEVEGSP